jgi:hypothetical protein
MIFCSFNSLDLVLISNSSKLPLFEVWMLNKNGIHEYSYDYSAPDDAVYFGQSIFADFGNLF